MCKTADSEFEHDTIKDVIERRTGNVKQEVRTVTTRGYLTQSSCWSYSCCNTHTPHYMVATHMSWDHIHKAPKVKYKEE